MDYFFAISGLQGDSTSKTSHGGLTVKSFSFTDLAAPVDPQGHLGGKPTIGDVSVTFESQEGLTQFLTSMYTGQNFQKATLYGQNTALGSSPDLYELTLADFRVTSLKQDLGGEKTGYTITLAPAEFEIVTSTTNQKGTVTKFGEVGYTVADGEPVNLTPATGEATSGKAAVGVAENYYLFIDGVKGDSNDKGFEGAFDLDSGFSFDVFAAPADPQGVTADPTFSSLLATGLSSLALPTLYGHLVNGQGYSNIKIVGATNDGQTVYRADLSDVVVTGVSTDSEFDVDAAFAYRDLKITTYDYGISTGKVITTNPNVFEGKGVEGNGGDRVVANIRRGDESHDIFFAVDGLEGSSTDEFGASVRGTDVYAFGFVTEADFDFGGAGGGVGRVSVGDVSISFSNLQNFTFYLDALNKGTAFSEATIYETRSVGGELAREGFYELTLNDFYVTSVRQEMDVEDSGFTVTLAPLKLGLSVASQERDGKVGNFSWANFDRAEPGGSVTAPRLTAAIGDPKDQTGATAQARDFYLTIDGVTGDSTSHKGAFELDSASFAASSPFSIGVISGGSVGRPEFASLLVNFDTDSALTTLTSALLSGKAISGIDVYGVAELGAGKTGVSYRMEMDAVFVDAIADDADGGFSATLSYRDLKVGTYDQVGSGKLTSTPADIFADTKVYGQGGTQLTADVGGGTEFSYYFAVEGLQGDNANKNSHNGLTVDGFAFVDEGGVTFTGSGISTAPAKIGDVSIAISSQEGLIQFLTALDQGETLSKATLYRQATGAEVVGDVYALTLADFRVTGVSEDGFSGYLVTLSADKFEIATSEQLNSGKFGPLKQVGYDTKAGDTVDLTPATGLTGGATKHAAAATDYYLTIDGVTGDSTRHKGAFELDGWAFDAFVTESAQGGSRPNFSSLLAAFGTDSPVTLLVANLMSGEAFKGIDIFGVTTLFGKEQIVFQAEFDDVGVASVFDTNAVGVDARLTYRGLTITSYDLDSKGGVGSSRVDLQACKLEYSIVSPK